MMKNDATDTHITEIATQIPIFRLDVSDCTVHILTGLASVQSKSWNEAKDNLIQIHYKSDNKGRSAPSYKHRWHFTTDRIQDNYSTQDISSSLLMDDQLEKRTITLNQKQNRVEPRQILPTPATIIESNSSDITIVKLLPET